MTFKIKKIKISLFLVAIIFLSFSKLAITQSIDDNEMKLDSYNSSNLISFDLKSYDIDDISNIISTNDKICINFTSDKTILTYDENGSFLKENDISNSLAVSILINSVRTIKYDSYLYYLQYFNNSNFYSFDNMNNVIYNFDNEFNVKTKRKLFVEEQFELEGVNLSYKFFTPTYNSLLFFDKLSNTFYLVENGGYTKVIICNYTVRDFHFDVKTQRIFIYNNDNKTIDIYSLRGIFIKTIKGLDKIIKDNGFKGFVSVDANNKIQILTTNGMYNYDLNSKMKDKKSLKWKNSIISKNLKINSTNILNVYNLIIKNQTKYIFRTENELFMLK